MSTVDADPKHEKVMNGINQVSLEVGKIESRLIEMGKGSRERSDSSKESESAQEGMPKGETEKGDAGGQVASYAGTLMKNVDDGSGSRDPILQKAIEESTKALRVEIEKREKAQQEKEMGEAIYQSMIELSKKETEKEMQNPPSKEEEAVLEAKAISLKLLKREREKKEIERKEADEEEAILRSVQEASKKSAAEELLKKQIDAALKASAEEIKRQVRHEVVQEVVVQMKLNKISRECAEAQALLKALNEEMTKVEEKQRQAKANAASLAEVMPLRISDKGPSKSESLIGEPESEQPLVLLVLGERSYEKYEKGMAKNGNIQFASGPLDCACSSITLVDEETFKKWRRHFGKLVRKVRWLKKPLVVNTAGDDKPLIVATCGSVCSAVP